MSVADRTTIERILEHAVWAPSGDNSQPWSFTIDGTHLMVWSHAENDHPIFNVEQRGTYIATGALVENIVHAAAEEGLACTVSITEQEPCVTIDFSPGSTRTHTTVLTIRNRHTNRGAYETALDDTTLEKIRAVEPVSPCRISIVQDRKQIETIATAASVMEETALQTRKLHEAFFKSIFFDAERNTAGHPGLYIKTTELPPPIQLLFRLMRHWPVMRALNAIGFYKIAASGNAAVYTQSAAILAITTPTHSRADIIAVGRTMQRLWLRATELNLAAQPLAGLLYLAEYLSRNNDPEFTHSLSERALEARQQIAQVLNAEPSQVAMLLRIGKPRHSATARAGRRPPRYQ